MLLYSTSVVALLQEMALETYQRALKVEEEMKGVSEDTMSWKPPSHVAAVNGVRNGARKGKKRHGRRICTNTCSRKVDA